MQKLLHLEKALHIQSDAYNTDASCKLMEMLNLLLSLILEKKLITKLSSITQLTIMLKKPLQV